jgi:D-beta-D-heptose 7-phosphate kinase/D-beta-D-heptose 1-phosphate adenosyltransferase
VKRDELPREPGHRGHPGAEKIKRLEELVLVARAAREAGKTLVFTNGCFDLLHLGHRHLLDGASQKGDLLIVGVNGDASVRRLKGRGRPKISQEERMLMLAGLEVVDYVICFGEDTPILLLEALRPDILVKGEEYKNGVVVGREVVEGYGGQVAFVSHIPGISTSAILGESASVQPRG